MGEWTDGWQLWRAAALPKCTLWSGQTHASTSSFQLLLVPGRRPGSKASEGSFPCLEKPAAVVTPSLLADTKALPATHWSPRSHCPNVQENLVPAALRLQVGAGLPGISTPFPGFPAAQGKESWGCSTLCPGSSKAAPPRVEPHSPAPISIA